VPRPRCGRSLLPGRTRWVRRNRRHGAMTRPTTTERGHHLPVQPMVGHHAGNLPRTQLRGTGEHLGVLVLPSLPTGTWRWTGSLVSRRRGRAQPVRLRCGGPGLPSTLVPATHGQPSTIPSLQAPCGQATTPPADHRGTSHPLRPTGTARRTEPFQGPARCGQRGCRAADTEGRPSGHLDGTVAWTPDVWTPDVRVTDWTEIRTAD
jgi:hypothetical protein